MNLMIVDRSGRGATLADALSRTNEEAVVHYIPGCDGLGRPQIITDPSISIHDHAVLSNI